MASVAQKTGQWLIDQLTKLKAAAKQRAAEISINNGHLMTENARADQIIDATARARVKAAITKMVARQVTIAGEYRTWYGTANKLATDGINWLRANGYATSGLSIAPLVPAAIVIALLGGAALWVMNEQIQAHSQEVALKYAEQKRLNDAYIAGQITTQQYDTATAGNQATTNSGGSGDPFANLAKDIMPIAGIVLLIMVAPSLLESFNASRRARAAA